MSYPPQDIAQVRRVTWWGLIVNLLLTGLKALFGWVGGSQALLADAVHSVSDCVTDFAVIFGAPFWSKPPDEDHPYGHGRIETIITLTIATALAAVGLGLAYNALATLEIDGKACPGVSVLITAVVSVVVKEWLYRWTAAVGRRVRSTAVVANAWHHRSDALSSVPVVLTAGLTQIEPNWGFLDHIATVFISAFILQAAFQIGYPAMQQLVDRGATWKERQKIQAVVLGSADVLGVHALRTRYVGDGMVVDLHLLVDPELSVREGHRVAGIVKRNILEQVPQVIDVLIHVEPHET